MVSPPLPPAGGEDNLATEPDSQRLCPACEGREFAVLGDKNGHEVRRCRECRSVYAATAPEYAAGEYGGYYHDGNLEVPPIVHRRLAQIVQALDRFRDTNRWLDVGCGGGALLDAAVAAGWNVEGTEVAPGALRRLAARGHSVFAGDLEELGLEEGSYDVITLIEVLEHLADPSAVAGRAAALLRPGGALYVTTPHACGISARILGVRWSLVCPPEHLQLFSRRGLRELLTRSGLRQTRSRTEGVNPYELRAVLVRREVPSGAARVRAAYELNAGLHSRRSGLIARAAVNAALNATGLGDTLKSTAVNAHG